MTKTKKETTEAPKPRPVGHCVCCQKDVFETNSQAIKGVPLYGGYLDFYVCYTCGNKLDGSQIRDGLQDLRDKYKQLSELRKEAHELKLEVEKLQGEVARNKDAQKVVEGLRALGALLGPGVVRSFMPPWARY